MDRSNWYFRQRVTNPEMEQFSNFIEEADWKNVRELLGSGILTGGIVKELPAPDSQFVAVEQTIARDIQGRRVNIIDTFGDTVSSIVLGLTLQVDSISVPSTVGTYILFTSSPSVNPFTLVGQKIRLSRSEFSGNNGEFEIKQVVTTNWGGLIPSQIMVRIDEELDEEGYESGLSPRGTSVIAEIVSGEDSRANAAFDELNQDIRPVNPGNERWVSLYARFDRVTFDTRLDGNGQLIDYIQLENFRYVVDASKPEALVGTNDRPDKRTNGDLFLADIQHIQGQNILNAQIDIGRQDKMNNLPALASQLLQYTQAIFHGPQVAWTGTNFQITGDAKLALINKTFLYNIPQFDIPLADGEVIYLEIDRNAVAAEDGVVAKTTRGNVPEGSTDKLIFILADRNGSKVQGPFAGEMEPGQVSDIGDKIGEAYLAFTGMTSETNSNPNFTGPLLTGEASLRAGILKLQTVLTGGGITQVKYVSALNGDDTNGTGSQSNPYKSLKAAFAAITDSSAAKRYVIVIGPGVYEEDNDIVTKRWVDLVGFSRDSVLIRKKGPVSGFVPFDFNMDGGSRTELLNVQFGSGLTINHTPLDAGGINLETKFVRVTGGDFVFNGLGGGKDFMFSRESDFFGNFISHSVALSGYMNIIYGTLELDDDNAETPDSFGSAATVTFQSSFINALLIQSANLDVYAQVYGSRIETTATVDDQGSAVPPTLILDSISHPALGNLSATNNAVIEKSTDIYSLRYIPQTASDWAVQPTDGKQAVDQLAALSRFFSQFKIIPHEADADKVRITGADITLFDGRVLSQELRNLLVKFEGAVLDFSTGEIFEQDGLTPLGIDFTPFAIPNDHHSWYGIGVVPATVGPDNTISVQILVTPTNASNAVADDAPKPVIAGTKKLGGVRILNDFTGGNGIIVSQIRQFGTGSGSGGGEGDANDFLTDLKARLRRIDLEWVAPNIFSRDGQTLIDDTSTAEFDVANNLVSFENAGDVLLSENHFGARFLSNDFDAKKVEIHALWETADENATWEVSVDGGLNFITVEMDRVTTSNKFVGKVEIPEPVNTEVIAENEVANADGVQALDDANFQSLAIPFTVADKKRASKITLYLNKLGNPQGFLSVNIRKDNGGVPDEIISATKTSLLSAIAVGDSSLEIELPQVLTSGDYWIVVNTSSEYKATYDAGVTQVALRLDASAPTYDEGLSFDGTVWAATAGKSFVFELVGFTYNLRVRVTNALAEVALEAYGVFFGQKSATVVSDQEQIQTFKFSGNEDKTEFEVTAFLPDARHLKIYDVNTGQVYRYPSFSISGRFVSFTAGTFLAPDEDTVLIFDQTVGGGFDNSDINASAIAASHLGSKDAEVDRSIAGRGVAVRANDNILVELTVDADRNLVIKEA